MRTEKHCTPIGKLWYVNDSKMSVSTGAGICGAEPENISMNMGRYSTIFQTEIMAILTCAQELIWTNYLGKSILIIIDSHAALKAER